MGPAFALVVGLGLATKMGWEGDVSQPHTATHPPNSAFTHTEARKIVQVAPTGFTEKEWTA